MKTDNVGYTAITISTGTVDNFVVEDRCDQEHPGQRQPGERGEGGVEDRVEVAGPAPPARVPERAEREGEEDVARDRDRVGDQRPACVERSPSVPSCSRAAPPIEEENERGADAPPWPPECRAVPTQAGDGRDQRDGAEPRESGRLGGPERARAHDHDPGDAAGEDDRGWRAR